MRLCRGLFAFAFGDSVEGLRLLLGAARPLEPIDPELARDTHLDAMGAAIFAGTFAGGVTALQVARAALAAPPRRARDVPPTSWSTVSVYW